MAKRPAWLLMAIVLYTHTHTPQHSCWLLQPISHYYSPLVCQPKPSAKREVVGFTSREGIRKWHRSQWSSREVLDSKASQMQLVCISCFAAVIAWLHHERVLAKRFVVLWKKNIKDGFNLPWSFLGFKPMLWIHGAKTSIIISTTT